MKVLVPLFAFVTIARGLAIPYNQPYNSIDNLNYQVPEIYHNHDDEVVVGKICPPGTPCRYFWRPNNNPYYAAPISYSESHVKVYGNEPIPLNTDVVYYNSPQLSRKPGDVTGPDGDVSRDGNPWNIHG